MQVGDGCAHSETRGSYVVLELPQDRIVGVIPLIVAVIIMIVELFLAFIPVIEEGAVILNSTYIEMQITYGLIFSLTLAFISNSLKISLNRRYCNPLGTAAAILATIFITSSLYTWLWANNGSLVGWFCKNFLSVAEVRVSASTIEIYAYNAIEKYFFDIFITWTLPFQAFVVVLDCIFSMFRRGESRQIGLYLKTIGSETTKRVICCLDGEYL